MDASKRRYVIFGVLSTASILLDQWTKMLAREHLRPLPPGQVKVVIDGFFKLRYSENPGVAFGMLQKLPFGQFLLTAVAIAAFAFVIHYLRKTDPHAVRMQVALGFVGGGAIGNLIDRIVYGRVTDFIVWHVKHHEWPAFNIADAALVAGVALMAIDMIGGGRNPGQASAAPQTST